MPGDTLNEVEVGLIKQWRLEEDLPPSDIATRLSRNKSTITRHLAMKTSRKVKKNQQKGRRGPARKLTDAETEALVPKLETMIKKAKGNYEVTGAMLKKSARVKVSVKVMQERLHEQGVHFYAMRLKPSLTVEDIKARYEFAKDYMERPRGWWGSHIHLIIDVKFFPIYLNGKARSHAAQSGTRGVYRKAGQALTEGYYKPNPKMKYNTGARGVHVLAGVGDGAVLLWEYIEGRWNGAEADRIYRGPMLDILKETYPGARRFRVLEDNDPTFCSRIAERAKDECKIEKFEIPRHSPQLNLCDYWLWTQINMKMRAKERGWPASKREDRNAYLRRLKRTALSLSSEEVNHAVGSMKRRCKLLFDAKGGQIEG